MVLDPAVTILNYVYIDYSYHTTILHVPVAEHPAVGFSDLSETISGSGVPYNQYKNAYYLIDIHVFRYTFEY